MNATSLILGTAQFSGEYGITNPKKKYSIDELVSILTLASSHGICRLDTAMSYSGVYSILSKALFEISDKSNFRIATKFTFKGISRDLFIQQLQYSRDTFRSIDIEVVFVHDWDQLTSKDFPIIEEIVTTFPNLKMGVSIYETKDLEKIFEITPYISVIQIPLSILNQSFLPYLRIMREKGVEIWSRSIFLQGAIDWTSPRNTFASHPSIIKLKKLGQDLNITPIELALDFIKNFSTQSVIGIATDKQLSEILLAMNILPLNIEYELYGSTDKKLIDPRTW